MEAELVRKKLWDMVEIVVPEDEAKDAKAMQEEFEKKKMKRSAQKMAEARAEMISCVDGGQLSHMRSRDPMDIWQTLADVHKARGFATQLAMKRCFLTAKKKPGQTIQAWVGEVRSMAFQMEEAGIVVNEQDKILAVTMGLPVSFEPVVVALDSIPTEHLTLEDVIKRILNDEVRQNASAPKMDEVHTVTPGVAAALMGLEKPKMNRTTITCHFCDQIGHYKSECPEKFAWMTTKTTSMKKTAGAANSAHARVDYGEADSDAW